MDEKDILRKTKEALSQALDVKRRQKNEEDRKYLVAAIGNDLAQALEAPLARIAENSKITKEEWQEIIAGIKVETPKMPEIPEIKVPTPQVTVNVPEIKLPEFPEIKLPTIKVPKPEVTVNFDASKIRIPDVVMPDEMNVRGWVQLQGVDLGNPLPVQIRDADGKPVDLMASMTQMFSSGGGRSVKISNDSNHPVPVTGTLSVSASATTAAVPTNNDGLTYNSDNPMPITGSISVAPAPQVSGYADSVNVMQYGGTDVPTGLNETTNGVFRTVQMTDSVSSVYITGAATSTFAEIMNPDGRVKVELPTGSSGLTDTELRASHLDVFQLSGSSFSVEATQTGTWNIGTLTTLTGITNTLAANIVDSSGVAYSGSNPVPVTGSVAVSGVTGSIGATILNGEGVARDTWGASQVGTWNIGTLTSITNSSAAALVDSSGIQYSGSNPVPISGNIGTVTTVTGVTNSLQATLIDSSGIGYSGSNPVPITWVSGAGVSTAVNISDSTGVGYSGSNPVPITIVSGALTSTISVGATLHDAADDGDAPLKVGGVAITANPTAVAGGDRVRFTADDLGRQLVRPVQVRDLITTAYVAVSNGTETTLKAAVVGSYLDCVMLTGSNNSDAAVSVDIRAVTAGNVVHTMQLAAYGLAGWAPQVPWPQDETGNNWTVDLPDITGTTVSFSGLFSKEV